MIDRVLQQVRILGTRIEVILRDLRDLARRITWAEQRIRELNFPSTQLGINGFTVTPWDTAVVAKSTSSIGARSGATYGTGTVKLQADGGSSLSDFSPTTTFTAKNLLNKSIPTNNYVIVVRVGDSWWVVAVGDCSVLT